MADPMGGAPTGMLGPVMHVFDITPDDAADLALTPRGIWVGGAGDLRITAAGSGTATLLAVSAGSMVAVRATRVHATGTTATGLVGLY